MRALERQHGVVAKGDVGRRGEVGGRGEAESPQDRGDMRCDPHLLARGQAAVVPLPPVRAGRLLVIEMGVDVDQHCANLPGFYFVGFPRGGPAMAMETLTSRVKGMLLEP